MQHRPHPQGANKLAKEKGHAQKCLLLKISYGKGHTELAGHRERWIAFLKFTFYGSQNLKLSILISMARYESKIHKYMHE